MLQTAHQLWAESALGRPPAGKAIHVRAVWKDFHSEGQYAAAFEGPHRREALQLQYLWQEVIWVSVLYGWGTKNVSNFHEP